MPINAFWSYRACAIITDRYGRFRTFLGGGAFFLADEDEQALSSVFLNGQCLVMVAVEGGGCSGSGRGHNIASYKGKMMQLSMCR
jgi:hypothetical protein